MDNQASGKFQFERGQAIVTFNPFHESHGYLLQKSREFCKLTDVYVGDRQVPGRLSRDIRARTAQEFIDDNGWGNQFNVISHGKRADLDGNQYDVFIAGSDILNLVSRKISQEDYSFKFPNILYIHREGMVLTKDSKRELEKYVNLIEVSGVSDISGSKIRQAYRDGKDISGMVSQNTWEIIKDHVYVFGD